MAHTFQVSNIGKYGLVITKNQYPYKVINNLYYDSVTMRP